MNNLAKENGSLNNNHTLEEQEIKENDVLWLETTVQPFAGIEPVNKKAGSAKYRSATKKEKPTTTDNSFLSARDALMKRVEDLGLN